MTEKAVLKKKKVRVKTQEVWDYEFEMDITVDEFSGLSLRDEIYDDVLKATWDQDPVYTEFDILEVDIIEEKEVQS